MMMCVDPTLCACVHVSQHSAGAWRSRAWCMMIVLAACLMQCHCRWTIELTVGLMSVWLSFEAPLSIPFVARVKFTSTRLSRTNSSNSKTSTCCSNVRSTLLLHMTLKRNVRTINSSKYAMDEIIETMFIPSHPPEVSAGISTRKCVVRFENECSRGARICSRLLTILSLPNTSTIVRHISGVSLP